MRGIVVLSREAVNDLTKTSRPAEAKSGAAVVLPFDSPEVP